MKRISIEKLKELGFEVKTCKNCGNIIKPKSGKISLCSDACVKENARRQMRAWYASHKSKKHNTDESENANDCAVTSTERIATPEDLARLGIRIRVWIKK
jgi:hypothetical protein